MEYLNEYHKQAMERTLAKQMADSNQPINYEEELKRHQEMHAAEKKK
ncbi:hypothetical protein [Porphyromonas loveana]